MKSYNRIPRGFSSLAVRLAILQVVAVIAAYLVYPSLVNLSFELFGYVFGLLGVTPRVIPSSYVIHVMLAFAAIPAAALLTKREIDSFHCGAWVGEQPSKNASYGSARIVSNPSELRRKFKSWRRNDEPDAPMLVVGGVGSSKEELLCAVIKHALILGSTGAGKTVSVLVPTAVQNVLAGSTIIALDPKGELFDVCARFAEARGYKVHLIDFGNPRSSDLWNPLGSAIRCSRGEGSERDACFSDLRELASILIPEGKGESNPMWTRAARMLFCAASAYVVTNDDVPAECKNLATVAWLLAQAREHFSEIAAALPQGSEVRRAIESSVNAPDETYGGFRVNALAWVDDYADPLMSRMLCGDGFCADDISAGKHIVFVGFNSGSTAYDALVAAFISQTMSCLRRRAGEQGGRLPSRVVWLLEEFGQLPRLPGLVKDSSIVRSMGMHLIFVAQSRSQIVARYGPDAPTLLNNLDTTLFLSSSDYDTLKHYSDLLGCYTVETTSRSQTKGATSGSTGKTTSYHEAKLIRPEELARWDWEVGHLVIDRGVPYACSSTAVNACFVGDLLGLDGRLPEEARAEMRTDRPEKNASPAPLWTGGSHKGDEDVSVWGEIASLTMDPRFM